LLYVKGNLEKCDRFAITIVGARHPTEYGRWAAKNFSEQLSKWGLTIVSGMASGIDSAAHKAAIASKGRTIAVLGNGLAKCYPATNKRLMDEISSNGAVISEFPMETPPNAYNFPIRNEILACLGLATFVVEANEMSGSLITARIAMEENRVVFALPGDINKDTSIGTNLLIRSGAIITTSPEDILEDLSHQLKSLLNEYKEDNLEKKRENSAVKELFENEKIIYEQIKREPQSIEALSDVVSDMNISISDLINILLKMELKGLIEKLPGQIYTIKS
jgi:DNA processing protein